MKLLLKKHQILLCILLFVLMSSLWLYNLYMLSFFVVLCCVLLPYKKWWDGISIPLLSFSVFYAGIVLYKGENPGWSFIFSMLFAPTAFYRLGRFLMKTIQIEAQRQKILIYIIGTYLLPLFLLTAQDMALTGLINDSRNMLLDTGEDGSLNATLYGMMASIGIGCIGAVFSKQQNKWMRMGLILVAAFSLLSVIHLVNRTGLVICVACLFVGFALSTRMNVSKMLPILLVFIVVGVFFSESGILGRDVSEAYADREGDADTDATSAGGRTEMWIEALGNILVSPLGWRLERYAHNMWLDIARAAGWLAFFPFVKATIAYLLKFKPLLKKGCKDSTLLILVCINVAMLLNASVEPVIDGSFMFFSLLMLVWGMTVQCLNLQIEVRNIENMPTEEKNKLNGLVDAKY